MKRDEVEALANKSIEMEQALHLHHAFWTAGLYSTDLLINEVKEYLGVLKTLRPYAKPDADLTDYDNHFTEWEKTQKQLVEHREEEVKEMFQEQIDEAGLDIEVNEVNRLG